MEIIKHLIGRRGRRTFAGDSYDAASSLSDGQRQVADFRFSFRREAIEIYVVTAIVYRDEV